MRTSTRTKRDAVPKCVSLLPAMHLKPKAEAVEPKAKKKRPDELRAQYRQFRLFMGEHLVVESGHYANFSDIYDTYLNWRREPILLPPLSRIAMGHYITKTTRLRGCIASGQCNVGEDWSHIYLGIKLLRGPRKTIRSLYGELYRFRHMFIRIAFDEYRCVDNTRCVNLADAFETYVTWSRHEGVDHYNYGMFSKKLRKFLKLPFLAKDKNQVTFIKRRIGHQVIRLIVGVDMMT